LGRPGKGKTVMSVFLTEELERHTASIQYLAKPPSPFAQATILYNPCPTRVPLASLGQWQVADIYHREAS
jgi:hypothetical protein